MATIIAELTDEVHVSNKTFVVIDKEVFMAEETTAGAEEPWGRLAAEGEWFAPSGNGCLVTTELSDQVVDVRFELWDGPPFSPSEAWAKDWKGELFLFSGKVCLTDWVEHFPPRLVFDLGSRETVWNIHAYMRRLREPLRGDQQSTSYDLESYLIRFWPQS
ncbi:hypothetical protein [Streptosporangium sp. NBC_01469]|uniref:hypothetical protein n=1 Tax=Streptosporangium sp. NBC_01469 TaxID=2903898 RepID=UPI002E29E8F7|nr:hypothetical protein [Streptosporangium sp. NBC_01469]